MLLSPMLVFDCFGVCFEMGGDSGICDEDFTKGIDASSKASGIVAFLLWNDRFLPGLSSMTCFSLSVARNK